MERVVRCFGQMSAPYRVAVAGGGLVVAAWIVVRTHRAWRDVWTYNLYKTWAQKHKEKCRVALDVLDCQLRQHSKMSPARVSEITSTPLPELVRKLQAGEWTAVDVLTAYQIKALDCHAKTNCLIEPVAEAMFLAEECDKMTDKSRPLHGVPVSIKESVGMQGYVVTLGLGKLSQEITQHDWHVVKMLKHLGAVPFVRTGFPQLQLSYEGSNPIFGKVRSHLDPSRIPGGSSSGEGALIGDGGSVLGIGTDIGGSVRAPAAFSGICSLKPGWDRVGYGPVPIPLGNHLLKPVWGPMTRDVDSLVAVTEALLSPHFYTLDKDVAPVSFNREIYDSNHPLRIGYFVDYGRYPASPACERAVLMTKAALEKAGHTLVRWTPSREVINESAVIAFFSADCGESLKLRTANEPLDKTISPGVVSLAMTPRWRILLYALFLRLCQGQKKRHYMEWILHYANKMTLFQWHNFNTIVELYRREVAYQMEISKFDAILSPAFPIPTPKYGNSETLLRFASYLSVYNVLEWPAGVVPVTEVTQEDVDRLEDYHTGDDIEDFVRKDMSDAVGLPVAVQIGGRKWQEEVVLRVMKEVEQGVKPRQGGGHVRSPQGGVRAQDEGGMKSPEREAGSAGGEGARRSPE